MISASGDDYDAAAAAASSSSNPHRSSGGDGTSRSRSPFAGYLDFSNEWPQGQLLMQVQDRLPAADHQHSPSSSSSPSHLPVSAAAAASASNPQHSAGNPGSSSSNNSSSQSKRIGDAATERCTGQQQQQWLSELRQQGSLTDEQRALMLHDTENSIQQRLRLRRQQQQQQEKVEQAHTKHRSNKDRSRQCQSRSYPLAIDEFGRDIRKAFKGSRDSGYASDSSSSSWEEDSESSAADDLDFPNISDLIQRAWYGSAPSGGAIEQQQQQQQLQQQQQQQLQQQQQSQTIVPSGAFMPSWLGMKSSFTLPRFLNRSSSWRRKPLGYKVAEQVLSKPVADAIEIIRT
jgi:hypothetical protein